MANKCCGGLIEIFKMSARSQDIYKKQISFSLSFREQNSGIRGGMPRHGPIAFLLPRKIKSKSHSPLPFSSGTNTLTIQRKAAGQRPIFSPAPRSPE